MHNQAILCFNYCVYILSFALWYKAMMGRPAQFLLPHGTISRGFCIYVYRTGVTVSRRFAGRMALLEASYWKGEDSDFYLFMLSSVLISACWPITVLTVSIRNISAAAVALVMFLKRHMLALAILYIKRTPLRWLRHQMRISPGWAGRQVPPGHCKWWGDYMSYLAWKCLGIRFLCLS